MNNENNRNNPQESSRNLKVLTYHLNLLQSRLTDLKKDPNAEMSISQLNGLHDTLQSTRVICHYILQEESRSSIEPKNIAWLGKLSWLTAELKDKEEKLGKLISDIKSSDEAVKNADSEPNDNNSTPFLSVTSIEVREQINEVITELELMLKNVNFTSNAGFHTTNPLKRKSKSSVLLEEISEDIQQPTNLSASKKTWAQYLILQPLKWLSQTVIDLAKLVKNVIIGAYVTTVFLTMLVLFIVGCIAIDCYQAVKELLKAIYQTGSNANGFIKSLLGFSKPIEATNGQDARHPNPASSFAHEPTEPSASQSSDDQSSSALDPDEKQASQESIKRPA